MKIYKIKKNTIQRKVEGKLFEAELKLEERRNQLLSKLIKEDSEYARELEIHYRYCFCFITSKLELILTESIDSICSLESKLHFSSICSVRISYQTRDIRQNSEARHLSSVRQKCATEQRSWPISARLSGSKLFRRRMNKNGDKNVLVSFLLFIV